MVRAVGIVCGLAGVIVLGIGVAVAQHHGHNPQHGHDMQGIGTGTHSMPGQSMAAPTRSEVKDTRELVQFPPRLAKHTLANMRDHLLALEEISAALAKGETDKAAKIAEARLGLSSMELHGAHEVAPYMPAGMQNAGLKMHRAASRFAVVAQTAGATGEFKPAIGALSDVMGACVGCHAGYRLK